MDRFEKKYTKKLYAVIISLISLALLRERKFAKLEHEIDKLNSKIEKMAEK